MTHDPVPQRLSDAERDAAAQMLREHFEAGRLDAGEFDERLSAALSARIAAELQPLFADLPAPRPDAVGAAASSAGAPWTAGASSLVPRPPGAVPALGSGTDWIGVARGVIWPLAIILALISGNWGTFIVMAIIGSIILGQLARNQRKPPPYLEG